MCMHVHVCMRVHQKMEYDMSLKDLVKKLPSKPGVYRMKDKRGNIIYVGKAKNLNRRVSQYFQNQKNRTPKVREMIEHIDAIDYLVTDTELDALINECRLIKELQPRYNRLLKNPGKYLYIKIPAEKFPQITWVNEKIDDGAEYFGPFTSRQRVEAFIQYINEFYFVRKCTSPRLVKRTNGCLYYQLGSCLGVCTGKVKVDEYDLQIEKIRHLLKGKNKDAVSKLLQKLDRAVADLKFEKASQYRDYFFGLKHIFAKQQLVQSCGKKRNIVAVEFIDQAQAKLFLITGNKLLYRKMLNLPSANNVNNEKREEFIRCLKDIFVAQLVPIKGSISGLTQEDIDEAQIIYSYLKKYKKRILTFWLPASHLKDATVLDTTVKKIIDGIVFGNLSNK
ncbi:MAG: GIY-YIG nuclease family protein [Dehalobacterium sp.]